jgi:hypothetical protein
MEMKGTVSKTDNEKVMLEDVEYFKYIFKKTEKIACAVFYILRSDTLIRRDDALVSDIEGTARTLQDVSLESLRGTQDSAGRQGEVLRHALITLESKLRIAHAARLINQDHLEVFLHEIDSVQRTLRKYIESATANPLLSELEVRQIEPRERKISRHQEERVRTASPVSLGQGTESRRTRVLNVLRDKGEATIKDIVEVVTDCSEKTIQRELISLIKDNVIVREGERRWSKYRLL